MEAADGRAQRGRGASAGAGEGLPAGTIPRMGRLPTLLHLLRPGSERIDVRTPLERLRSRHGDVVSLGAGRLRCVALLGPDANRFVLTDGAGLFSARIPWLRMVGRIFPDGLLLRDGSEHAHLRRILHGPCSRSALPRHLERMNPRIERALEGLERARPLRAFDAFKALILDLAASIFAGVEFGSERAPLHAAFEAMEAASMSRLRLPLPGLEFHRGLAARERVAEFLRPLVERKRDDREDDLLGRLCRATDRQGGALRDPEVLDHLIFLLMAAHDTTASTLTSLVYELARRPAWQDRVREESRALGRVHLTFADLERLPALTWVMRETLRRYPPLPVIPRVALRDFVWNGYRIPDRSMVVVAPIHTHHMPEWWQAPDAFDPQRFAPERAEDRRHTHAWIPFGGGPHACLGRRFAEMQVRAIVHQLALRYRWRVPEGYAMPVQQAPISRPRDGLPLWVEPLA